MRARISVFVVVLGCGSGSPERGASGSATEVWPGEGSSDAVGETSTSATDGTSGASNDESSAASTGAAETTSSADDSLDDASTGSHTTTTSSTDAGSSDESSESSTGEPADDGVLDVTIYAYDDCEIVTEPASITVPAGTDFTVRWHNAASSAVEVDIAKIDAFNQVPIILGFEPGTSYHDDIRQWCGDRFTGTFSFRIDSCYESHYLEVDCGG